MEDVGGRWVVYNDDFAEFSAQPAEVFDIVSSVENTGFPEEPGAKHPPLVQQVCHRVSVLKGPQAQQVDTEAWADMKAALSVLRFMSFMTWEPTLAKLAVKRTHSNSSPIFWRNSSTWGLFSTYTCSKGTHTHTHTQAAIIYGETGKKWHWERKKQRKIQNNTLTLQFDSFPHNFIELHNRAWYQCILYAGWFARKKKTKHIAMKALEITNK